MEIIKITNDTIIPFEQFVSFIYYPRENKTVLKLNNGDRIHFDGDQTKEMVFITINGSEVTETHI